MSTKKTKPDELNKANSIIEVADAIERAHNWRNYWEDEGHTDYIKAFFIRKEDIEELHQHIQNNENAIGCRGYFGKYNAEVTGLPASTLGMMFVVVENAAGYPSGKDILVKTDQPNISEIYDFTSPCPTTCDMNSELFGPQPAAKKKVSKGKR